MNVHELIWNSYEREGSYVEWDAEVGRFNVYYNIVLEHDGYRLTFDNLSFPIPVYDTLEEAQDAAQEDFQMRISECCRLPLDLAQIIEKEMMEWKGENGGVYSIKAASVAASIAVRASIAKGNAE